MQKNAPRQGHQVKGHWNSCSNDPPLLCLHRTGGPLLKKLAHSIRLLSLSFFLFFFLSWHSIEIKADAATENDPVAQTGLTLPTKPVLQTLSPAPVFPTLQPALTQIPIPATEAPSMISDAFQQFVESVVDGQAGVLRGVYVEDVLALKVIQQPANDPLFVSKDWGIATQFQNAAKNSVTGILAHNYLSGELFFQLGLGQQVQLVYGDGKVASYIISNIQRFQKLQPNNPRSRYIDLNTGEEQSTEQVFNRVYTGRDHVTFQACIKKGDEWSWGLIFVIATPVK